MFICSYFTWMKRNNKLLRYEELLCVGILHKTTTTGFLVLFFFFVILLYVSLLSPSNFPVSDY